MTTAAWMHWLAPQWLRAGGRSGGPLWRQWPRHCLSQQAWVWPVRPVPASSALAAGQLGGTGIPHPHLLPQSRQRRPPRGVGGAGTVRHRAPGDVQIAALAAATGADPATTSSFLPRMLTAPRKGDPSWARLRPGCPRLKVPARSAGRRICRKGSPARSPDGTSTPGPAPACGHRRLRAATAAGARLTSDLARLQHPAQLGRLLISCPVIAMRPMARSYEAGRSAPGTCPHRPPAPPGSTCHRPAERRQPQRPG